MSDLVVDYEAKGRYRDANGEIQFINRKSKKGGETTRQAAIAMETVNLRTWLLQLDKQLIQFLYENGWHDRAITNRRKEFVETEGKFGISRNEALEWYRFVYSFLSPEQLAKRSPTFDNFTNQELGLEVKG